MGPLALIRPLAGVYGWRVVERMINSRPFIGFRRAAGSRYDFLALCSVATMQSRRGWGHGVVKKLVRIRDTLVLR